MCSFISTLSCLIFCGWNIHILFFLLFNLLLFLQYITSALNILTQFFTITCWILNSLFLINIFLRFQNLSMIRFLRLKPVSIFIRALTEQEHPFFCILNDYFILIIFAFVEICNLNIRHVWVNEIINLNDLFITWFLKKSFFKFIKRCIRNVENVNLECLITAKLLI